MVSMEDFNPGLGFQIRVLREFNSGQCFKPGIVFQNQIWGLKMRLSNLGSCVE